MRSTEASTARLISLPPSCKQQPHQPRPASLHHPTAAQQTGPWRQHHPQRSRLQHQCLMIIRGPRCSALHGTAHAPCFSVRRRWRARQVTAAACLAAHRHPNRCSFRGSSRRRSAPSSHPIFSATSTSRRHQPQRVVVTQRMCQSLLRWHSGRGEGAAPFMLPSAHSLTAFPEVCAHTAKKKRGGGRG